MTDLKLVIEDTIDNVATLQDCSADQGQSVQLLGENTKPKQDKHKSYTSSFNHLLKERLLILLFSISDFCSKCPKQQDGAGSGHLAGAEDHVCGAEGSAPPTGDPFCLCKTRWMLALIESSPWRKVLRVESGPE